MKLWYDRKSKDPTYFIQLGVRNGKKTTTKNVARIGRHSELLKLTADPFSYAKEQVRIYNEEVKRDKVTLELNINFAEKIKASDALVSSSKQLNIGYFFLQQLYHDLEIAPFFCEITEGSKITFDPNQVHRFLTFARILNPDSKLGTQQHLGNYYEQPEFDRLDAAVDATHDEYHIDTTVRLIGDWEDAAKLSRRPTWPIERRRERVKSRLYSQESLDLPRLKEIIEKIGGVEVELTEHYDECVITVRFVGEVGVPLYLDDIKEELELIRPYHIWLEYEYIYMVTLQMPFRSFTFLSSCHIVERFALV